MSLLEDTLQQQQDLDIRHLVQRQFTGVYSYVTMYVSVLDVYLVACIVLSVLT